jgi:hypothetical protein
MKLTQSEIDVRIAPGPNAKWSLVKMVSNGPKYQTWILSNGNHMTINKFTGHVHVNMHKRFNSFNPRKS